MKRIIIVFTLMIMPIVSFAQENVPEKMTDHTNVDADSAGLDKSIYGSVRAIGWRMRDLSDSLNPDIQNDNYNADIPRYRLYPTTNMWTFIKLDTRSGRMWQVQYSVEGDEYRFESELNDIPLVSSFEEGVDGRFTLIPTQNTYNFILLDQYDGTAYQTQWSQDKENRGVMLIQSEDVEEIEDAEDTD